MRERAGFAATLAALLWLAVAPATASAKLAAPERDALTTYLSALQHANYETAFGRLSPDERRYFRSARNLAAVFGADRLAIEKFTIVGSSRAGAAGSVAVVRERFSYFDHAHGRVARMTANVRYGLVPGPTGPAVKDPYHPWFAFAPSGASAETAEFTATVRKIAFYTGRVEVIVTFSNRSERTVTVLPYGRSVLRDDAGAAHAPVRSPLPGLMDRSLFEGLRLPPSGQYTGTMTFFTPDRFTPKRLDMTFAPALVDGGDAPFELKLPTIVVPAVS